MGGERAQGRSEGERGRKSVVEARMGQFKGFDASNYC